MGRDVWQQRAALPGLRSVLDPTQMAGVKNLYIDFVHHEALRSALDLRPGQRVLDLGSGVGRLTDSLTGEGRLVVGVDISDAMLAIACRSSQERVSYVRYGGSALPFSAKSFDRILSVFVLQHVIDDRELMRLLAETHRVTTPGGRVAIIEQVERRHRAVGDYVVHRTRAAYSAAFMESGYRLLVDRPIRPAVGFSVAAARNLLPLRAFGLAQRVDRLVAPVAMLASYADSLFVFEREI